MQVVSLHQDRINERIC